MEAERESSHTVIQKDRPNFSRTLFSRKEDKYEKNRKQYAQPAFDIWFSTNNTAAIKDLFRHTIAAPCLLGALTMNAADNLWLVNCSNCGSLTKRFQECSYMDRKQFASLFFPQQSAVLKRKMTTSACWRHNFSNSKVRATILELNLFFYSLRRDQQQTKQACGSLLPVRATMNGRNVPN